MANAAIFNALMRPVRSVNDYLSEYEDRDYRQAQMQQNQLAAMEGSQIRRMQVEALQAQKQAALLKAQQEQQRQSMRGNYLNSIDPNAGPAMEFNPASALRAGLDEKEIGLLSPKSDDYKVVNGALLKIGPGGVTTAYQAPAKPQEPPEVVQIMEFRDKLPQGDPRRAVLDALITKQTTHAPAASAVSYASPVPFMLPDGGVGYAQPGNKAGAPPQVMTGPGGKPLVKPPDAGSKMPAELQRMQIAGTSMVRLMDDYEKSLKSNNPRDPLTQMNPTVRADMQAMKRNIELQFKELQALGALAGPDIDIIRQSLSDPFTFAGAYYGRDGLLAQIKRARDLVRIRSEEVMQSQGRPNGTAPAAAAPQVEDPLGLRGGK